MESVIEPKSFEFSLRIVNLYNYLRSEKAEYVLSKQMLRSGTSIGANVCEAEQAQSRADFISKMNIALKESVETEYWLRLLYKSGYLNKKEFDSIHRECKELVKMLTSIIKTTKNRAT